MFYRRDLEQALDRYSLFPVVAILGPRQSGKTTLARNTFKKHTYVSFEDPAIREFATVDPRGFLRQYDTSFGVILDEFQYVPDLLSYIQLAVDEQTRPGYFVLTGSQNFLINEKITQSLAGRVGILTLLPFCLNELATANILPSTVLDTIVHGSYPRIYTQHIPPADLYPSYISTYVERDVRMLLNVGDLNLFGKFLALCAGRIGQLLNLSDIATNCGISVPTVNSWISLLEASYIAFRLQPHFTNFNKRVTKTPKLFFYDTGLACSLLGIRSAQALALSHFKGNLFENLIISDIHKQYYNTGQRPPVYFWRDKNGTVEVDAILDRGTDLVAIEIKSSETIAPSFFHALQKWNEISETSPDNNTIVYAGTENQSRTHGNVIGWQSAGRIVATLNNN